MQIRNGIIITSEVQKIASLYRETLRDEFPQYHYFLSGSDEFSLIFSDGAFLRVIKQNIAATILTAEFASSFVQISSFGRYGQGFGPRQLDFVDYSDPKFTEDILAKILREYP